MKICFVTTHLTTIGGANKFLMDYANNLDSRGHIITIVAQRINQNIYNFNRDVSLIKINGPLPSNPLYWLKFNKIREKYKNVIKNLDVDFVISKLFPSNYFCSSLKQRRKFIHIYYCEEPFRFFYDNKFYSKAPFYIKVVSLFLRLFFKKYDIKGTFAADEIICNSDFTRKRVKEIYRRDSYLHYIGVEIKKKIKNKQFDFNLRETLNLNPNSPILFSLGYSHHMKGAKELINIFHKILFEEPESVLLIGGWIKKENKNIIEKSKGRLKIPKHKIILYGYIENNLLDYFYSESTITLYPAIDEPFGLIPLESMKNGTPVIAFKEGGPSETILDGKTGYLIKFNDIEDFARKASMLIRNKELYEEFLNNAIKHVEKNFAYGKCISDFELLLEKLLFKKNL